MLLKEYKSIVKTENGYIIHADAADLMLVVFLKEDVIRIRVSFDRTFPEASYALVTTAWEDRLDPLFAGERKRITALDVPYEDGKNKLVFHTGTLRLVMRKCLRKPVNSCMPTCGKELSRKISLAAFPITR